MISATIVIASVVLALIYVCAWWFSARFRHQIEQPKHWFQDQVEKYDRDYRSAAVKETQSDAD